MDATPDEPGAGSPKPERSRIELHRDANALTIYLPPAGLRGPGAFLLFFSILWNGFMAVFTPLMLIGMSKGEEGVPWFLYPFLALFWAVGLGILYAALRLICGKTFVRVEGGQVFIQTKLFNRAQLRQWTLAEKPSARLAEAYKQNEQPVYAVAIKTTGRDAKFGTSLKDDEKDWLVGELNAFFGAETVRPQSQMPQIAVAEHRITGARERPSHVTAEVALVPARELRIRFAPLARTALGRVALVVSLALIAGWIVAVVLTLHRILGGDGGGPGTLTGVAFIGIPIVIGLLAVVLPLLLRRAELMITRSECRLRNALRPPGAPGRGGRERVVPLGEVQEAVLRSAGPFHWCSLKRHGGPPADVYALAPVEELEWLVFEINRFLQQTPGL